jgi:hypothetical protein
MCVVPYTTLIDIPRLWTNEFLIYANMNPTIPMNDDLESECTYIDDISMIQAANNTDNANFRLKTRSEIQMID